MHDNLLNSNHHKKTVLIMAAGTGGHVFPAMAVADELLSCGVNVCWLGTPSGMENKLTAGKYPFFAVDMQGLRGNGVARLLKLPFALLRAVRAVKKIIKTQKIDMVIGFGGYVTPAGGVAAKLSGIPLIIHEQNAIAGLSNKSLARLADKVLQAFEGAFDDNINAITVGNPLRKNIQISSPNERYGTRQEERLRLLVVGGSLGAMPLNRAVVEMLLRVERPLNIIHQCGQDNYDEVKQWYNDNAIDTDRHNITLKPFIEDMGEAYAWADLVLCRAGALTVSEIVSVGVAAIFVPLPHAVDDHQSANAKKLTTKNSAILLPQTQLTGETLADILDNLGRQECCKMANTVKDSTFDNAASDIVRLAVDLL